MAVVMLHAAAPSVDHSGEIAPEVWQLANFLDASCRWCVPIFVMLSGALLLDPTKREPIGLFYRKRLLRVGIPLVFWSAFYLWWTPINFGVPLDWRGRLAAIALANPYYHLYFLFIIVGLYLVTPMLRPAMRDLEPPLRALAVAVPLLLASASDLVNHWLQLGDLSATARFVPYLGYYIAGHVLATSQFPSWMRWAAPAAFVLGVGITVGGAAICDEIQWPRGIAILYSSLSPNVILMSLALFVSVLVWMRTDRVAPPRRFDLVRTVADASLGVYVVHPLFFDLLGKYGVHIALPQRLIDIPLWATLVFLVSLAVTVVVREIPIVRRIMG